MLRLIEADTTTARWAGLVRALSVLLVSLTLVTACVTTEGDDSDARQQAVEENDPIEPFNRAMFQFNRLIDTWFIKPLAVFYMDVLPPILQEGIHNALNNLRSPVIFANDVLQGEMDRAGTTVARFLINTTAGVGGLGDPATDMGYPFHKEDFGQTLAVWGMDEGPYLVLPVIGPSNPRDAVGLVVDYFLDPLMYWAYATDHEEVLYARAVLVAADSRAEYFDALEDMERTSLDFYATSRSLYRQRRADEIANGQRAKDIPAPGLGYGFDSPSPGDELSESK